MEETPRTTKRTRGWMGDRVKGINQQRQPYGYKQARGRTSQESTGGSGTNGDAKTNPQSANRGDRDAEIVSSDDCQPGVIRDLQRQIFGPKEDRQRCIWELEAQIRDLKSEIEEMRQAEDSGRCCEGCGRGRKKSGSVGHHWTPGVPGNGVGCQPRAYTAVNSSR